MKSLKLLMAFCTSAVLLAACAAPAAAPPTTAKPTTAPSADHSGHAMPTTNAPFDAQFIDGMIVHHRGAIDMANDALSKVEKPEIKTLAQAILKAQDAEIKQMKGWRKQWYPDVKDTGGMQMDMGPMSVTEGSRPYDIRFIDAMIPHHEGAIAMANEALKKAEKPEIKMLAQAIIKAQTAEIEQMKQWRTEWTK
jgi:uncharacterized protein (DUF305 family)